jgi:Phage integrase, N-terminal SAM-like domain
VTPKPASKSRRRDGLFQRRGWWWLDYTDADGKRHRQKGAPDYQTAKLILREKLSAIAKGEALGVRGESIRLSEFVERKYWPTVKANVSPGEAIRARSILDIHILPRFGGTKLAKLRREDIERWQAERRASVSGSTANKELMRLVKYSLRNGTPDRVGWNPTQKGGQQCRSHSRSAGSIGGRCRAA